MESSYFQAQAWNQISESEHHSGDVHITFSCHHKLGDCNHLTIISPNYYKVVIYQSIAYTLLKKIIIDSKINVKTN